jgi:hypothetical protein
LRITVNGNVRICPQAVIVIPAKWNNHAGRAFGLEISSAFRFLVPSGENWVGVLYG